MITNILFTKKIRNTNLLDVENKSMLIEIHFLLATSLMDIKLGSKFIMKREEEEERERDWGRWDSFSLVRL